MKKHWICLLCAVLLLCIAALPFLCVHPSLLPEKATAYYELKAYRDAMNATGPEAELMRLLLGSTPAPEIAPFSPRFSLFGGVLALGAIAALVVLFHSKDSALRPALLWTGILSLPLSLLGARLIYCLSNLSFFLTDIAAPEAMLRIWEGGLSLCGALAYAVVAGIFGAKIGKAPLGKVLDRLAPALVTLALFSALADQALPAGFGPETEFGLPLLTLRVGESFRLNTALLYVPVLAALLIISFRPRFGQAHQPGSRFALTVFLYGGSMIFLESLRRDGHMLWGFVHAEMAFDLAFALPALLYLAKKAKKLPWAFVSSLALSGLVIALEFALDRSSIGDIWLYLVYFASISAYLWLGCSCAKRAAGI